MNERINKLITQAGTDVSGKWISIDNAEKLVKLAVQDCIGQVALLGISNCENEDVSWAVDIAIENIKRRFGVK